MPIDAAGQITCPVCGGGRFEPLFEKRGEAFVRCLACTLMLINPPPAVSSSTATYNAHYTRAYIRKAAKKLRRCRGWVRRIQRRFVSRGRWLDVGCSAGFIVAAAADAGFDAHGVELEPAAITYGREVMMLKNLRCGVLTQQCYPGEFFDVISLYDVIEHVPDLNGLVAEIMRLLAPGGVVEIRTPDVGHWRTPRDLARWEEVKPSEHLYYFNRSTLEALFANHGFRVAHRRPMFKSALDVFFHKA
ncbi:MAG: class I SAM-dependent methyltransferase [Proteobacteria bacterium]|nr:MAG: class I SAM-dependent methyltransferase [Pseudomonadota bacterium]